MFPIATQCSTYHGNVSFTTNALGFARVYMYPANGTIGIYKAATHTEVVVGDSESLLASPYPSYSFARVCSAGMKLRSSASFANEQGVIQAYSSLMDPDMPYDVYRDTPHQRVYSKGEVAQVRWLPSDPTAFYFTRGSPGLNATAYNHLGFMVSGAPSQPYSLQYAFTLEYVSASVGTDLVPLRLGEHGDPYVVASSTKYQNPAHPESWTFTGLAGEALRTAYRTVTGAAGGALLGGYPGAVTGAAAGLMGAGGYYQSQSGQRSGNQTLALGY